MEDHPTKQQLEAFRFVANWCHANRIVPPEIHDAAAFALDLPSLAHGFYTPACETQPNDQSISDDSED
ncbi:hypothetical protein [Crateriforma conspicua]|uniref:Uncharacterized protein n=1 Tax=Crateriforma conspicua TaxID=2527996 RepID=A0A5C5Y9F6_9PLAN|nr:hypothetical protein [Crateriforma conspicua]TWT71549.1 hypothetical protein Pan14r_38590 [Crateriforma conspicua]